MINQASRDLLDILLDENNRDPIILFDEKGRQIAFEQIAIIPFQIKAVNKLYVVLKPKDELEGVASDEAIVFCVDDSIKGNTVLRVETDEKIAIGVFNEYYKLLEQACCKRDGTDELERFISALDKKRKGGN